jgi:hypothetical protein
MRHPSVLNLWLAAVATLALATMAGGCVNSVYSLDSRDLSGAYMPLEASTSRSDQAGSTAAGESAGDRGQTSDAPDSAPSQAVPDRTGRTPRQMVYSARFRISTPNVEEAVNRLGLAVENNGGYLESREDAHVVCRVPAERFGDFMAAMPALGSIVSQAIRNQDVTREHQDLNLRIETAEWSRRRVLALLERAEKIEDILKLEEELARLTATVETLQGALRDLSEQIAYSKVEVFFESRTPESKLGRPAAQSPFAWINHVGVEQVAEGFGSVETPDKLNVLDASALLPGGISIGAPDGFLIVKKERAELKAITPDASKLWARQFAAPQRGTLDFWSKALKSDLVDHRGYVLTGERHVRDKQGHEGVEMTFDVVVQGSRHRYLIALFVPDGPFWQPAGIVRTIEFAAPEATFDKYVADVRRACGWGLEARGR